MGLLARVCRIANIDPFFIGNLALKEWFGQPGENAYFGAAGKDSI
jgi:hypothetical protein